MQMQSVEEQAEKKRRLEVSKLEERMNGCVVQLTEDHDRALRQAEDYYSKVQKKLLKDQKGLKVQGLRTQEVQSSVKRKTPSVCGSAARAGGGEEAAPSSGQRVFSSSERE